MAAMPASPTSATPASAPSNQQQRLSFDGALTKIGHQLSTLNSALDTLRAEHRAELLEATRKLRERNAELAKRLSSDPSEDTAGLLAQELMEEEPHFNTSPSFIQGPKMSPVMNHPLGSVRSTPFIGSTLDGYDAGRGVQTEKPSVEFAEPEPASDSESNQTRNYPLARISEERRNSDAETMWSSSTGRSALSKRRSERTTISIEKARAASAASDVYAFDNDDLARVVSEPRKAMRASVHGDTLLNRQPIEMEKVWERPRPVPNRVEQRRFSQGGDTRYMFDVFAKANFSNMIARSRLTDELSNSVLQRLVMEPSSLFSMMWNMMEVLLLSYDLIVIPVLVANMEPPETIFSIFMTYLSVIFWTLDIPISFFKGFVTRTGDLEMRMGHIAVHYAKTRLLYDVTLLSIEWVNFGVQTLAEASDVASSGRLLRLLRFSRLLKVSKMQRLLQALIQRVRSNVVLTMLGMSKVVIFILLCNHMLACGWYMVSSLEDQFGVSDPNSYSTSALLLHMSFGERYSSCLHWSLSQLGFGTSDIYPDTNWERVYAAAVAVISLMLLGFLLGSVVTGMTRLQMLLKVQREQEEQLRDYLCRHKVSWPLRNRIWIFLRKHIKTEKMHVLEANVELITKLPKAVLCELRAEVFIPILTVHPFFGTYAVSTADKFAMHTLVEKYAVNEFALDVEHELFAEGDVSTSMYFLVQGQLLYRLAAGRQNPGFEPPSVVYKESSKVSRHESPAWAMMEKDEAAVCGPGQWLCEAALWLRWVHVGSAVAKTHCEVVSLIAEKFQTIMHMHLPEAQKYARLFLQYAKDHRDVISDSFVDVSCLRSMAHDIFEPPIAFEVSSCFPVQNELTGRNDWRPSTRRHWQRVWTTPWKEGHYLNRSALLATMTTDMKHDAILMYQTLFSQNHTEMLLKNSWLTEEEVVLHDQRVGFLKRLLLCFATCRVSYTTENNGLRTQPWAFPLASVLSHGSRVLLRLNGVPWRDFVNFLIFGDQDRWNWEENGVPGPLYVRRAASHGVRLDPRTSDLQECKLKNLQAFGHNHLGMDIPVGGLGNPTPSTTNKNGTLFVGPGGVPFRRARRKQCEPEYIKEIQHGHLYMRWDDFGSKTAPVLIPKEMLRSQSLIHSDQALENQGGGASIEDRSSFKGSIASCSDASSVHAAETGGSVRAGQDSSAHGSRTPHFSRNNRTRSSLDLIAGRSQGTSRSSLTNFMSMGAFEWTPVPHMRSIEDLDSILTSHGALDLVKNEEAKHRLLHLASKGQELALEASSKGRLRCHGVLVHLVVELARDEDTPQSQRRILVHQGATAGISSSDPAPGADVDIDSDSDVDPATAPARIEDKRVLTVLCCHHESWASAVTRYCQQVFSLSDAALERLMDSCQSEGEETFNYRCEAAPTICHHHQAACKSESVPLVYDALRLKSRLYERDRPLFGSFFQTNMQTMEHSCELHGFANRPPELGAIAREWRWVSWAEAQRTEIQGLSRPEEALSLHLARETKRLSSLLIGIESSAPLKEDFFGNTHGVDAKSKDRSAMGKPKWRAYGKGGQEVPADLGGIKVCVNEASFEYFKVVCKAAGILAPRGLESASAEEREAEQQLFKELLQDNDESVEKILARFMEDKGGEALMMSRNLDDTRKVSRSLNLNLFST